MRLWIGRDADVKGRQRPDRGDEFHRAPVAVWVRLEAPRVPGGVAAQRHDVSHAGAPVAHDLGVCFRATAADAGQVAGDRQGRAVADRLQHAEGRVGRAAACTAGHGDEAGPERCEPLESLPQSQLGIGRARREDLEGDRRHQSAPPAPRLRARGRPQQPQAYREPLARRRGRQRALALQLESGVLGPTQHLRVSDPEAAMRVQGAQLIELVCGEVRDQQASTGTQQARGVDDRLAWIVEQMQHVVHHRYVEAPRLEWGPVQVAMADGGTGELRLAERGARELEHVVVNIQPDALLAVRRQQLEDATGAGADVQQAADRPLLHEHVQHRTLDCRLTDVGPREPRARRRGPCGRRWPPRRAPAAHQPEQRGRPRSSGR